MNGTLRVLVVDDEPGMRSGAARALQNYAVSLADVGEVKLAVEQASSGEEALEMVAAATPDILLLDHKLPGLSGLDVLERLPQVLPQLPAGESPRDRLLTIMITAYASLETAVSAIKAGAHDFLAKPFTPRELQAAVRKAAEGLLLARQARRLAAEKRQVRFQFISVLAHELKAPLAVIEGYLRIVRERSAGDDADAYDHMLDRSLLRLEGMRKLIADLLDLTRIESGQKARELIELDVRELATAAVEGVTPQAAAKGIQIALRAPDRAAMLADRGEIEIILNNLLSNAIKYNRDGGRVDVTIGADDTRLTLAVADTGIGMSPEEAQRVFNDFVRIKNDHTRHILGSGLGLSIVRKLATLYGGAVAVESRPGAGSTFTVTLARRHEGKHGA